MGIASTNLKPPYYAVIFSSIKSSVAAEDYSLMANQMMELASQQKGFLGVESAREGAFGITVSYWESLADIKAWKANTDHQLAQQLGKEKWYEHYYTRICEVLREYEF